MKILSKDTVVLKSSFQFSEDKTVVKFQANTKLYVDGNLHEDLYTEKTVFDLECPTADIMNIETIAEQKVTEWVDVTYNA